MGQSLVSKTRRLALEYNLYKQIQRKGYLIIFCQKCNNKKIHQKRNKDLNYSKPEHHIWHSIVASVLLSDITTFLKNYIFILFLIFKCV